MPTPTFYLSPTGRDAGLTSIALGLIRALDRIGLRVHFFKPIAQPSHGPQGGDRSVQFVQRATNLTPPAPIPLAHAEELISENESDELMQEIVPLYQAAAAEADVVIVEGLLPSTDKTYVARLNADIAESLRTRQELQLAVAQLEAPERIRAEAIGRLGMIEPAEVTYLEPLPAEAVADIAPDGDR